MQYAIQQELDMAIDHSIYQDKYASNKLLLLHHGIEIKGTRNPVPVYTLSSSKNTVALRILYVMISRIARF